MQTAPGCRSPWSCELWCMLGSAPPPWQKGWHTLVKILPCPKLRLRAVIKQFSEKGQLLYWINNNLCTQQVYCDVHQPSKVRQNINCSTVSFSFPSIFRLFSMAYHHGIFQVLLCWCTHFSRVKSLGNGSCGSQGCLVSVLFHSCSVEGQTSV